MALSVVRDLSWLFPFSGVLVLAMIVVVSGEKTTQPLPTPYPQAFSISFATNVTESSSNGENRYAAALQGERLFYDWTLRRQRIDHAPGSYECVHFYQTNQACTLLFLPEGMYRIIHNTTATNTTSRNSNRSTTKECCLDLPGVGTPPPDWASMANPTFDGIVLDEYSRMLAYQFTFDNLSATHGFSLFVEQQRRNMRRQQHSNYHTSREVARAGAFRGRPLLFSFPGTGVQDYHYNVSSMKIEPQSPILFGLPDGCKNRLCPQ